MADTTRTTEQEIARLTIELRQTKAALGNLIAWIASSANSPIRMDEASALLNTLNGHD